MDNTSSATTDGGDDFSYSVQAILLAVVPKFPAALSMLGSFFIVLDVLRHKSKQEKLSFRIILGLSCSDILASSVHFIGTWFVPQGTIGDYGPVYMALGTDATCSASGFLMQMAVCSPLYNGSLCLYYLLSTNFAWSDRSLRRIEPFLHAIPICFAVGTATAGLALDLYGSVEWVCWVSPVTVSDKDVLWKFQWTFLFIPLWIVGFFVTGTMLSLWWTMRRQELKMEQRYQVQLPDNYEAGEAVVMTKQDDNIDFEKDETPVSLNLSSRRSSIGSKEGGNVDATVHDASEESKIEQRDIEDQLPAATTRANDADDLHLTNNTSNVPRREARRRRSSQHSSQPRRNSINTSKNISNRIAVQGMMYIGAFYVTWFFPSLQRIIELATRPSHTNYFVLQFFDTSLLPFQGFLNVVIFVRPRYAQARKRQPELGFWKTVWNVMVVDAIAGNAFEE